jgi:hypothetical protein
MESDTGNSDGSFVYNVLGCFNTHSAVSAYVVFSSVAFILEAMMANDDEKNQIEELQETADLVESPYETEEQIVEVNDEILDEGVTSKIIKSSVPQQDGTVKTLIRIINAQDKLVRCFGCKRLFPRRKAGVYNKRYFCRECFPYTSFYFKRFFGFFTGKEEDEKEDSGDEDFEGETEVRNE